MVGVWHAMCSGVYGASDTFQLCALDVASMIARQVATDPFSKKVSCRITGKRGEYGLADRAPHC